MVHNDSQNSESSRMAWSALDLRVFILINGVMAALMALVLFSQSRTYPKSVHGLRELSVGYIAAFVSTVLFGLQNTLHPLITIGLSNVLLLLTAGYILVGVSALHNRPVHPKFIPALLCLAVPLFAWLSTDVAFYQYRLTIICVAMPALLLWQANIIWRFGDRKLGASLSIIVLVALSAVMLLRAYTAVTSPLPIGLYASSPMQTVYLGSLNFGLLLSAIGAILMASERLHFELAHLASKDSLTNAYTRRALFELGENEMARCKRHGTALAALMLDLDHFKRINDKHGHQVGDQVLIDFVQRVQAVLRRPAILGRYGGEEFLVLLPETGRDDALAAAERIRQNTTRQAGLPVCTVSVGLACLGNPQTDTLSALIGRADAGLYRAKEMGRNRVEKASP